MNILKRFQCRLHSIHLVDAKMGFKRRFDFDIKKKKKTYVYRLKRGSRRLITQHQPTLKKKKKKNT